MFFEFFVREWLAKRIVPYAITHTAVASLFVVALAMRFTERAHIGLGTQVWVVAALAFVSFLGIDILRKIWAPENEIDGVDSYSKLWGLRRAGLAGCAVLVAAAALAIVAGRGLGGGVGWIAVVAAVTAWGCAEVLRFTRKPDPKKEKMMQVVAGVHLLVLFIGLAIVPVVAHGALFGIGDAFTSIGVGR
jgi:4-hydroxybenzoate polyprenyltransferase